MNSWIGRFLDYLKYERNYSVNTIAFYRQSLRNFVDYLEREIGFGAASGEGQELDIRHIDADIIRGWIISLMERGYKRGSVHGMLSSLKSFFKFLRKEGVVSANPAALVKGPKCEKPLPYFIKDADMERVLDEEPTGNDFKSIRNHLIVEMLYDTGMRRAELIGLQDADVDFALEQIRVVGKRDKQRLVPFTESLKDLMYAYLQVRNQEVGKTEYFFVRPNGEQLYPQLVYSIVRKQLSGIPMLGKRSPHVLRHSFATSMLNNGAELNAVKELLGHGSLASTSVYTHTTFEELKKVYHAHPRAQKEGGKYGN